jgi:hypothetical protein
LTPRYRIIPQFAVRFLEAMLVGSEGLRSVGPATVLLISIIAMFSSHGVATSPADAWDEYADAYETRHASRVFSEKTTALLREQDWWKSGLTLLDHGCGPGAASLPLAKHDGSPLQHQPRPLPLSRFRLGTAHRSYSDWS